MAKQFIVKDSDIEKIDEDSYKIFGSEVKHIQVLRYNIGDKIKINGVIYEIIKMTKKEVYIKFIEKHQIVKRNLEVSLYVAVLKNEMMDLAIKKAVELGVSRIIPFYSKNVVVKLDDKEMKKKEKYNKIAIEAVKQCNRNDIPIIDDFKKLEEIDFSNEEIVFLAYEKEKNSIKSVIQNLKKLDYSKIGIIVGPEGGFDENEIQKLTKFSNIQTVGLGTRILRAETAVISMISIINYEFEK